MYLEAKPPKLERKLVCERLRRAGDYALDFIEDDAGGLIESEQSHSQCDDSQDAQDAPVGAWQLEDIIVVDSV